MDFRIKFGIPAHIEINLINAQIIGGFTHYFARYGLSVLSYITVSIQIIIKALVVVSKAQTKQPCRDQYLWFLTGIGSAVLSLNAVYPKVFHGNFSNKFSRKVVDSDWDKTYRVLPYESKLLSLQNSKFSNGLSQ